MVTKVSSVCFLVCMLVLTAGARKQGCPNGSPLVHCKRSPCDPNPCQTGFTCIPNYCGGCFHECVCLAPLVPCLVDPCFANPCSAGQTCVSNYCGGCNRDCYDGPGSAIVS